MKILIFSDIHGDAAALNRLLASEADMYVAAGDLTTFNRGLERLAPVLARRADRMWILPGNHEHARDIEDFCDRHGFQTMHRKALHLNGFHIAGLGHSNPTPFHTPGEDSEATIAENLSAFAGLKPLVLICHCPPLGTPLDEAAPGRHLGSSAVAAFITKEQPEWFVCGHIHEAAGREALLGTTRGVNAGKQGYLLELPA
ncbi:MAG: metallophosphoesterase [Bryobacteraceae bacterium]